MNFHQANQNIFKEVERRKNAFDPCCPSFPNEGQHGRNKSLLLRKMKLVLETFIGIKPELYLCIDAYFKLH